MGLHTRAALLIGCSDYEDLEFPQSPAPVQEISALKRIFADPSIGDFTVDTVFNRPSTAVSEQIESFFADRKPKGEPHSATYLIGEIRADGTVITLK